MDKIDKKILACLQTDSSGSVAEIAERAGVSQTPCWKRIKRLEQRGIIKKRVALINRQNLNLNLVGYIQIRTAQHNESWLQKFSLGVQKIPEIVECHRMAGEYDYLLKIVTTDMAGYDTIYKRLIKIADMKDVSGTFSMEELKSTTELPLDYLGV